MDAQDEQDRGGTLGCEQATDARLEDSLQTPVSLMGTERSLSAIDAAAIAKGIWCGRSQLWPN